MTAWNLSGPADRFLHRCQGNTSGLAQSQCEDFLSAFTGLTCSTVKEPPLHTHSTQLSNHTLLFVPTYTEGEEGEVTKVSSLFLCRMIPYCPTSFSLKIYSQIVPDRTYKKDQMTQTPWKLCRLQRQKKKFSRGQLHWPFSACKTTESLWGIWSDRTEGPIQLHSVLCKR